MIGPALDIMASASAAWWHAAPLLVADGGGTPRPPGFAASFRSGRYAITTRDAASIPAAPLTDLADLAGTDFGDGFAFTRMSGATSVDAMGLLVDAGNDQPRFDWSNGRRQLLLEGASTNTIRNNTSVGVANGVVGSGGSAPANWTTFATGLTCTILGAGILDGVDYVDVRFQGTTGDANGIVVAFEGQTNIAAATGEIWSISAYLSLIGGSLANASSARFAIREGASGGALVVQQSGGDLRPQLSSSLKRIGYAATLSGGGSTAYVQPRIHVTVGSGVAMDFTLRIGVPQCEKSQLPTSVIRTAGSAVTRAADSCQFGAKAAALIGRAAAGLVVRGQGFWGTSGAIVGGASGQRLVGLNSSQTILQIGNGATLNIASGLTVPLAAYGLACGWDGTGRSGSMNGAAIQTTASTLDTSLATVHLGRAAGGSALPCGWYDELLVYPFRPSNAALVGKAVAYA